jgi:hypothetical protein
VARHTFRGEARKAGLRHKEYLRRKTDIPVSDNLTASTSLESGFAVHYCQNMTQLECTNVNDGNALWR